MRLGVLKTGAPPTGLERFGDYPQMFRKLFGEDAYDYAVFAVDEGRWPAAPDACDAYLVTGSPCGAYDPLPWIAELKGFLNAVLGRAALVGICFGHQIMAEAFGGKVIKSPKGWGVGEHLYQVVRRQPWMDQACKEGTCEFRLPASHQDQVVALPPGAEVFAASAFTPFGGLVWPGQKAISLQLHPEFEPDYAVALIEARRARLGEAAADRAIASFEAPDDRARVGGWIRNFLATATS